MSNALLEIWQQRHSVTDTRPVRGVLSVSFSYWRGFGARIEAGEVTLGISGGSDLIAYNSKVAWPKDNYETFVIEGISDAMYQFAKCPLGVIVTLERVGWHDVHSCGPGFYYAAREAMFSAMRILEVKRGAG